MTETQTISESSATAHPSASGMRSRDALALAAIAVVCCMAYVPALRGDFLWDDNYHVPKPELQSLHGLYRIWFDLGTTQQYYPLLESWFWLQHRVWGDWPLGYHLMNLGLHLAAAYLVYSIMRYLAIPGALLAAGIFALHPLQVESVAWITEQKNTFSGVFYLGAMLAYLHFDRGRTRGWYTLALGLFVLAILSKSVTATLPGALLVIAWWQRGQLRWRRDVLPLAPLFLLGAAIGLFTAWVERTNVGAQGPDFALSLSDRLVLSGQVIWFYVAKFLWPMNLMFVYPRWTLDSSEVWQWLPSLAVLAVLGGFWAMRGTSRAPLAAALFFIGTLFPVLGFFNVFFFRYSWVTDHFQYLACLGLIVPMAAAVSVSVAHLAAQIRWLEYAACTAVLGALAVLSCLQSRMYANTELLFATAAEQNPDCWLAHNNLGTIVMEQRGPGAAIEHFERALRGNPAYVNAHNNLAVSLHLVGRDEEAMEHFKTAVQLEPNDPYARISLGLALVRAGQQQEALAEFQQAVAVGPSNSRAHSNLATMLSQLGRAAESQEHFEQSVRLAPDDARARHSFGIALLRMGRLAAAIEQLEQAVQLDPSRAEAHYFLGKALSHADDAPQAIEHFEAALKLEPKHAKAHTDLGLVLIRSDRLPDGIGHLQEALRLKPDDLQAWAGLAEAQAQANRAPQAIAAAEKALELARAQAATSSYRQIEDWLRSYRAGKIGVLDPLPDSALPPTTP